MEIRFHIFFYLSTWMYWLVVERNFRSVDLEWWQPLLGLLYSSPQWNGFMSHNAVLWFLPCLFVVETNEIESILDYMDSYNINTALN